MVNRGSTAQALALDRTQDEAPKDDDVGSSAMFSALKFGWNAIFSNSAGSAKSMSDAELERLLDRTRGLGGNCASARIDTISPTTTSALLENQECTIDDFEETKPLVKLREFGGDFVARGEESITMGAIAAEWEQTKQQRRENAQRCNQVHVTNVGIVAVLKSNQYTLESGEVSVYQKELKGVEAMKDKKRCRIVCLEIRSDALCNIY